MCSGVHPSAAGRQRRSVRLDLFRSAASSARSAACCGRVRAPDRRLRTTDRLGDRPAYYAFPDIHWQKIRTNNPLERIMKEIRGRTRVVGAFRDGQSCLNLAAARLRYIAGTAWSAKRYMNM